MVLRDDINNALKEAMKAKDERKISTLRLVNSTFKNADIEARGSGKTLSEAIRIMSFMTKDHHIDPELFDLFLRSGVYREYAERHMKPEQIDSVDLAAYLDSSPAIAD